MKTRIVQIVFIAVCLVLLAALQDMLPTFGGTKPPVLAALVLAWAFLEREPRGPAKTKRPFYAASWIPVAILAGAFEDALSGFPTGCASGFLVLAGGTARLLRPLTPGLEPVVLGVVAAMVAAPLHELWLCMWGVVGDDPSGLVRFFASALPAAPTGAVLFLRLPRLLTVSGFEGPSQDRRWA